MAASTVSKYVIQSTRPDVRVSRQGVPQRGVTVTFYLSAYDETHEVFADTMDAKLIKAAIEAYVKERDAVANLSTSE